MIDFRTLIRRFWPELEKQLEDRLVTEFNTRNVGGLVAANLGKSVSRAVLKGIDSVANAVAQTVGRADPAKASQLYLGWVAQVAAAFTQMLSAIATYAPAQFSVALAEVQHGKKSPEAAAARTTREQQEVALRAAVEAAFAALLGGKQP